MSAVGLKLVINHGARAVLGVGPCIQTLSTSWMFKCSSSWSWSSYSTAADTEQTPSTQKKKQKPKAPAKISSVGRKIPYQHIELIDEMGENMGTMHRVNVIRIMNDRGLKLVLHNENKDPPIYKLMTGKQLYEEQVKQREKDKEKTKQATVQVKGLSFSPGIASHDLSIKLKQVEGWLEKKHHVRITLRPGYRESKDNLDTKLEQMVQQIGTMFGFVAKPTVQGEGKSAMCVLRPPSAKEMALKRKDPSSSPQSASEKTTEKSDKAVSSGDATDESPQH
ncbi:translation initiation factor IF-3, mitochondrial [Cynoglossus semilaevis]|nr:translation initiation factor IF-3, mitochondrial [Cynoglossus semilaevis]